MRELPQEVLRELPRELPRKLPWVAFPVAPMRTLIAVAFAAGGGAAVAHWLNAGPALSVVLPALASALALWLARGAAGGLAPAHAHEARTLAELTAPVSPPAEAKSPDQEPALPSVFALIDACPLPLVLSRADDTVIAASLSARRMFPGLVPGRPISLGIRDPDMLQALKETASDRKIGRAHV